LYVVNPTGKYDGPNLRNSDRVTHLQKGEELVSLEESTQYWVKVRYNDIAGWVKTACVKVK